MCPELPVTHYGSIGLVPLCNTDSSLPPCQWVNGPKAADTRISSVTQRQPATNHISYELDGRLVWNDHRWSSSSGSELNRKGSLLAWGMHRCNSSHMYVHTPPRFAHKCTPFSSESKNPSSDHSIDTRPRPHGVTLTKTPRPHSGKSYKPFCNYKGVRKRFTLL